MNWNFYVLRRKIDVKTWLQARGINNREQFINHLKSIAIDPPDENEIANMFPQLADTPKEINESQLATAEGVDQVAPRSVVGEGSVAGLRTSRKQDAKFRSGRN